MDNEKKLNAPKPVRMNPFTHKNRKKISQNEKSIFYRNSDRFINEIIIFKHCTLTDDSYDISELEKDFDEIEARYEIFSILNCDISLSLFAHKELTISNSSSQYNESIVDIPYIKNISSKSNANIRS